MARKIHTRQKRRYKIRPHQGGHKVFKKLKLKRLKRAGLSLTTIKRNQPSAPTTI